MLMKAYSLVGIVTTNNLNILGSSLLTPLLIIGLLWVFERTPASVLRVLTLSGKCSYELFLIHFAMVRFVIVEVINPYVCLIASFIMCYLFHIAVATIKRYY